MPLISTIEHRVDPEVPIEDVAGAVKDLVQQGKSSASDSPKRQPRRSGARTPFIQSPPCKANTRSGTDNLRRVLPALKELGIGFVPFSPLGKGFLTGKIDETTKIDSTDFRSTVPRFSAENRRLNQAVVDLLSKIAHEKGATPARLRLPGCFRKAPGLSRYQAQQSCIA